METTRPEMRQREQRCHELQQEIQPPAGCNRMTPEDKKLLTVLNKIHARTKTDVLEWEPSEDPNVFAAKVADYTISIERAPETARSPESFNVSIANSDGLVIEELDSYLAAKSGFDNMKEIFERARRHALDINGALDDLIRELDDLSDQKS